MESSGVVDAAVILLARDGRAKDAMDRLVAHLQRLQQTLSEIIAAAGESPDLESSFEASTRSRQRYREIYQGRDMALSSSKH